MRDMNVGDTVEVLADGAYQGEVGVIAKLVGTGAHVRFADGLVAPYLGRELRLSQVKLDLPDQR